MNAGAYRLRLVAAVIALTGFCLLGAWAWPDLRAWLGAPDTATACRIPEEHEQLHIVVVRRGRAIAADCMYVVSRGQAQRATKARP